jgi:hypothetical protein
VCILAFFIYFPPLLAKYSGKELGEGYADGDNKKPRAARLTAMMRGAAKGKSFT